MSKIKIFNEDCFKTMNKMQKYNTKVDLILTSPPYNNSKNRGTWSKEQKKHYDLPNIDTMNDNEYLQWTLDLFNNYDKILNKNGVILYNISYSTDKPFLMYEVVGKILEYTNFKIADTIIWKKKSALPNNMSSNRLTRICELIFVFVKEEDLKTFNMNKEVLSIRDNGIKQYTTYYNFIEAKNNDKSCKLNKATFSSELCEKLLYIYAIKNCIVYDSFMGTGTTAFTCKKMGLDCFGSELSKAQVEYANKRLNEID